MTFGRVSAWISVFLDDWGGQCASSLDRVDVPIQGPSRPVPADPVAAIAYPHGYADVYHLDDPPDPALVIYQLMIYDVVL